MQCGRTSVCQGMHAYGLLWLFGGAARTMRRALASRASPGPVADHPLAAVARAPRLGPVVKVYTCRGQRVGTGHTAYGTRHATASK